jgi:hypothetical protein
MPPWLPEHGFGDFAGELRLTDAQIQQISNWVEHGAPQGDSAETPAPPDVPNGWPLGPPDLIIQTARPFLVPASGTDVFWNFILKPHLTRTRFIRALDIRP